MEEYRVTDPQTGKTLKLTGDSPPTEAELEEIFSSLGASKYDGPVSAPMDEDSAYNRAKKLQRTTPAELIAGSAPARFVQGVADYPIGMIQSLLQSPSYAPDGSGPDLGISPSQAITPIRDAATSGNEAITNALRQGDQMRSRGREAYGSEGMDVARLSGNISTAVGASKNIPLAKTLKEKMQQGAVLGGAFGGMTPTTSDDPNRERMVNAMIGAGGGAAFPPVVSGAVGATKMAAIPVKAAARTARNVVDPWLPAGLGGAGDKGGYVRARDRVMRELVGNENLPQVQRSLEGPLDPTLTGGQAGARSGVTEVAALDGVAKTNRPTKWYENLGKQRAQRLEQIDEIGGTADDLAKARQTRKGNADVNYAAAYERSVKGDKVITELLKKINGFIPSALKSAGRLARVNGIKLGNGRIKNEDFTQYGQYLKTALDKAMARTGDKALDNTERKAVKELQQELTEWLGKKNSAYENARTTFAQDSIPVNRGQIGQELRNSLKAQLEGRETPNAFAGAMNDAPRTIKRATGQNRFKELKEVLAPEGKRSADRVLGRLENEADASEMAGLAKTRVKEVLGTIGTEKPPTLLSRPMMLINAVLSKAGSSRQGKVLEEISDAVIAGPEALRKIIPDMTIDQAVQVRSYLQGLPSMQPISRTTSGILAQQGNN